LGPGKILSTLVLTKLTLTHQNSDKTKDNSIHNEDFPPIPMSCNPSATNASPLQIFIHRGSILPADVEVSSPVITPNALTIPKATTPNRPKPSLSRQSSEESLSSASMLSNFSNTTRSMTRSVLGNIFPAAQTKGFQLSSEESYDVQKGVVFGILSFFLLSNVFGILKSLHLTYCWEEVCNGCSNTPSILTGMRVEILSMCHEWVMIFNICNGIGLSLSWSFTIKFILFIYTIVSSIIIKSLACNDASYNDCVKTYPAAKAFVHIISYFLYGFYLNKMDGITNQLFYQLFHACEIILIILFHVIFNPPSSFTCIVVLPLVTLVAQKAFRHLSRWIKDHNSRDLRYEFIFSATLAAFFEVTATILFHTLYFQESSLA